MVSPELIVTAVEVGGVLSNLVSRWNEHRAEELISAAQAYLQQVGSALEQERARMLTAMRNNTARLLEHWFKSVDLAYGADLRGLKRIVHPDVAFRMADHIYPKFRAIENLSNLTPAVMPGVYRRVQHSTPADTATAALLYGLADGIEGLMHSNGLKASAKQYVEQCLEMGSQAGQALHEAAEGIDAFFELVPVYKPLKEFAHECISANRRWSDMDEETRFHIQEFWGFFGLLADFWDYASGLLQSRGEGAAVPSAR